MIDDYEKRKRTLFGRPPFDFGDSVSITCELSTFRNSQNDTEREFEELADILDGFSDSLGKTIDSIQNAVKILSLGIDYRRYVRFWVLTPHVRNVQNKSYRVNWLDYGLREQTEDDVKFCINFVIETALALQEFDFTIESREISAFEEFL